MIAAARRGATVRILLDSFFDDAKAPAPTAPGRLSERAGRQRRAGPQARTGNPTGGGIHMKLVLVKVGGETWTALGSLNGGEVSHKVNREVVMMVDHPAVYDRLAEVFAWDWAQAVR